MKEMQRYILVEPYECYPIQTGDGVQPWNNLLQEGVDTHAQELLWGQGRPILVYCPKTDPKDCGELAWDRSGNQSL